MAGEQSGTITSFLTNKNTDISNTHVFPPTFYQIWHVSGDVIISPFPFFRRHGGEDNRISALLYLSCLCSICEGSVREFQLAFLLFIFSIGARF